MEMRNGHQTEEKEKEKMLLPPLPPLSMASQDIPLTDDTACGFGCLRGSFLQRFANKKMYVFLYGLLGSIFSATFSYFSGTISTLEKRFRIPSRSTGIISVGNDISQLLISAVLSYYAGRGHRPRWIAVGIYTVVLFCLLNALPHFIYGPGDDALNLVVENPYAVSNMSSNESIDAHNRQLLCQSEENSIKCDKTEGNLAPQLILFTAQLIAGVGGSLYYTLGVSYMDDNVKKSKTPALISLSYFIRMLGPAGGYVLASICLKMYIAPDLTPTITNKDPRWLGAWWVGWIVLGGALFIFGTLLGLFPKQLPRAALRRLHSQRSRGSQKSRQGDDEKKASVHDMFQTFKRLLYNPTNMCNNFASIFYFMGYMPYWIFMPKYIETIYKQSASRSNLITGTFGLGFSAAGILIAGVVLTKFKPRARSLALWNVIVAILSVAGILTYTILGCSPGSTQGSVLSSGELDPTMKCNSECNCDYVKYTPVCAYGKTYISPCHAGCTDMVKYENNTKVYTNCSCVASDDLPPVATDGACPIDCSSNFYIFLAVVCFLKFNGATGRAGNFLVSVRCVEEKDKPVAMGFGLMLMSLFAFIPSPILFGYIIDTTCLVWGKTCSGKGNCWLYDGNSLIYVLNFTAAVFVGIGTLFDIGVWYYVKDLPIFDEDEEDEEKGEEK